MQRWEYLSVVGMVAGDLPGQWFVNGAEGLIAPGTEVDGALNSLGQLGWELVAERFETRKSLLTPDAHFTVFRFKRPALSEEARLPGTELAPP